MLFDTMGITVNYNRNMRQRKKYNKIICDGSTYALSLVELTRNLRLFPHNAEQHIAQFKQSLKGKNNYHFRSTRMGKHVKEAYIFIEAMEEFITY